MIGQGCEFDYSGTQACRALRDEGFEVVLVNSNPATIMTDPEMADRTYIEPLSVDAVSEIIAKEKPDALLPTVGGQTGLNLSVDLHKQGILKKNKVKLIGANIESIKIGEDRELFQKAMDEVGIKSPQGAFARSFNEAQNIVEEIGYPSIIRPAFTLGGTGGGTAYNPEEFKEIVERGLSASPVSQILIEESILGWKEFELEVMRDLNDNVVVICPIENFDPMGVHTGDSITVAPAQTLSDVEYQILRDMSIDCIRKVGVETGGSNIQFAVNPEHGEIRIIEMNPRVSRSSALASKATGFPIAKIAAKLAVGYTLDEIPNDITKKTPASFEPTLDYVVTKIPKWTFEKFPGTEDILDTQMKSVGEIMAIGRTFKESLFKGLRSLEAVKPLRLKGISDNELQQKLARPNSNRFSYIIYALQHGFSIADVHRLTQIDLWFLHQLWEVMCVQDRIDGRELSSISKETLQTAKRYALSDRRIAFLTETEEKKVRDRRKEMKILPVYKRVDTCGAEFESFTPYLYSTYEEECEADVSERRKIMVLGSGPNRIGQGIEFDYCCCHASFALSDAGFETIMVNCNPETVSTDYDTSDRLYFEPLTFEDVMNIFDKEKPEGVIVQFGGQTPLNLSNRLHEAGVPIIGTSPDSIDLAEDRKRFSVLLKDLNIPQPANGSAISPDKAKEIAGEIGYPVIVRPSFVLGGRAMAIVYDEQTLDEYMRTAVDASPEKPILIDQFLERAVEIDVDALADDTSCIIAGIQEHIEEAGIHSGDSSSVLPPQKVALEHIETIKHYTKNLAQALKVKGLMNIQLAIKDNRVFVIEVNPRASRTVPFVAKATGISLVKIASLVMADVKTLAEFGLSETLSVPNIFVKSPVFPFKKFEGIDPILGPEMHSTGEVMGIGETFGEAYGKAMEGVGIELPKKGTAFISVNDDDKGQAVVLARRLSTMGFALIATYGTARRLKEVGLKCETVFKVNEGRPNIADYIKRGEVTLVINTPLGKTSHYDEKAIHKSALRYNVPTVTTITGAEALIEAISTKMGEKSVKIRSLQEIHYKKAENREMLEK